jgi:hypothetical protein
MTLTFSARPDGDTVSLPLGLYRLNFVPQSNTVARAAPAFPGSAWRGALGHALRRLACLTGAPDCGGCLATDRCAYAYVFDTPVPAGAAKMRRYASAPHPFMLRQATETSTGVDLRLTLVGRANSHLPLIVLALAQAAAAPRGIGGRRLQLAEVSQESTPGSGQLQRIDRAGGALAALPARADAAPAPPEGCVLVTIHTPLRVKRDGRHVGAQDFRFSDLFGNLLRRISMLSYFHTDAALDTDFRALMEAARSVVAETSLRWQDLPRHSSRQAADMQLGGVVGTLRFAAGDAAPFWPYLWLGQFIHAGTAATMGLGHYTLASLPRSDGEAALR